jgi:hypothetical protein
VLCHCCVTIFSSLSSPSSLPFSSLSLLWFGEGRRERDEVNRGQKEMERGGREEGGRGREYIVFYI